MVYNGSDKHKQALFENKQDKLVAGSNITLTPQLDGTVEISAEGGSGTVTDVEVNGTSVVDEDGVAEIIIPVDDVNVNGVSVVDANKVAQVFTHKEVTRAQYDALPDSKYSDGIIYCITDGGSSRSDFYSPIVYSLAEREVGVWTDGKPLYQKTYSFNQFTYGDWFNMVDLTDYNISNMVNIQCTVKRNDANGLIYTFNGSMMADGTSYRVTVRYYNKKLQGIINGYNDFASMDVTLQYTKTTDNPGTGRWAQDGVPAINYSTDEKVIGTWVDGSTLYQKSYHVVSPTINSTVVIQDASMSNIGTLVSCFGTFDRAVSGYVIKEILNSYENMQFYSFARVIKESPNSSEIGIAYKITADNSYVISNLNFTIQYTKSS